MPVTLTIKQVPDQLADRLRQRAAANRRSQQQELLLLLERAVDDNTSVGVAEPIHTVYHSGAIKPERRARKVGASASVPARGNAGKLDLDALWQRARKLGATMPSEASAIVRADRDAGRH